MLLESFSLEGTIELVDSGTSPETALAAFKGTALAGYPVEERSSASTALDVSRMAPGDCAPPAGTLLYIDRAFTVKGVGTVVLGFALSGSVSVHDKLRLIPDGEGLEAEVNGIQINDEDFETAGRGIRVGLSLKGVEAADLQRTHWLDDGAVAVSSVLRFAFRGTPFYKQPAAGREMHLQVAGETLAASIQADRQEGMLTARLQHAVPAWEGMRTAILDLNAKNLRVAGGCVCKV